MIKSFFNFCKLVWAIKKTQVSSNAKLAIDYALKHAHELSKFRPQVNVKDPELTYLALGIWNHFKQNVFPQTFCGLTPNLEAHIRGMTYFHYIKKEDAEIDGYDRLLVTRVLVGYCHKAYMNYKQFQEMSEDDLIKLIGELYEKALEDKIKISHPKDLENLNRRA